MRLLGVAGAAGSGKDQVAAFLVPKHVAYDVTGLRSFTVRQATIADPVTDALALAPGIQLAIADPVKYMALDVFGFKVEQLWGTKEQKNAPDKRYPRKYVQHAMSLTGVERVCLRCRAPAPEDPAQTIYDMATLTAAWPGDCVDYLTPREAMQQIGMAYRAIYEPTWMEPLFRRVDAFSSSNDVIVISDVRLEYEARAIRERGGGVWLVERPGAGLTGALAQNATEQELNRVRECSTAVLDNRGTLDDLRSMVASAFKDGR